MEATVRGPPRGQCSASSRRRLGGAAAVLDMVGRRARLGSTGESGQTRAGRSARGDWRTVD